MRTITKVRGRAAEKNTLSGRANIFVVCCGRQNIIAEINKTLVDEYEINKSIYEERLERIYTVSFCKSVE